MVLPRRAGAELPLCCITCVGLTEVFRFQGGVSFRTDVLSFTTFIPAVHALMVTVHGEWCTFVPAVAMKTRPPPVGVCEGCVECLTEVCASADERSGSASWTPAEQNSPSFSQGRVRSKRFLPLQLPSFPVCSRLAVHQSRSVQHPWLGGRSGMPGAPLTR